MNPIEIRRFTQIVRLANAMSRLGGLDDSKHVGGMTADGRLVVLQGFHRDSYPKTAKI